MCSLEKVIEIFSNLTDLSKITIPNYESVREKLIRFVSPDGPAYLLVYHYYLTGKNNNPEDPPIFDPTEQAKYCLMHFPYFSRFAKYINRLRNKVFHGQIIHLDLLEELAQALLKLQEQGSGNETGRFLITEVISKFLDICSPIVLVFQIGNSQILQEPKMVNRIQDPQTLQRNEYNLRSDPSDLSPGTIHYLSDIKKHPESSQKLKGKIIRVLKSDEPSEKAMFRSWSGGSSYVQYLGPQGRRVCIRNSTAIVILDEP